jgi:hypothetical protein
VDRSGELVVRPQFDRAGYFSEGMAAVRVGGKHGYIDTSGELVIPPEFDGSSNFEGGKALVKLGEEKFFIDRTGATIDESDPAAASL